MLVLSRRIREQVVFPGLNIKVSVLTIGKNRVQLGIEAPRHIDISRPEVDESVPEVMPVRAKSSAAIDGPAQKFGTMPAMQFVCR